MRVVLTIAGSDSSGGAGIQADLKTFEAFGVFGTSALTVLTAQNTTGVRDIHEIDTDFIKAQIEAVLEDFDVRAIKIGMLYSNAIIDTIREIIKGLNIPIVLDTVFVSKAGSKLLHDDAIENMKTLFPYATLITPNLYEAKALFGYEVGHSDSLKEIIDAPCSVLIKNHVIHMPTAKSIDTLYMGHQKRIFMSEYIETTSTHGTGCSYSSSIAANLALGHSLEESVEIAKKFIVKAIKNAPSIGSGKSPIAHQIGASLC